MTRAHGHRRHARENRARFLARLRPVLAPSAVMRIEGAYVLTKDAHRGQTRQERDDAGKLVRYFEHPRRVALILLDELDCIEEELIIVALFHDGIEDTRTLRAEFIECFFGERIAQMVRMLSKVPKRGYHGRLLRYADWRVLLVKLCDRLDNLRALHQTPFAFQQKQLRETEAHYLPLCERLIEEIPKRYRDRAERLHTMIRAIITTHHHRFPRGTPPR